MFATGLVSDAESDFGCCCFEEATFSGLIEELGDLLGFEGDLLGFVGELIALVALLIGDTLLFDFVELSLLFVLFVLFLVFRFGGVRDWRVTGILGRNPPLQNGTGCI